MNELEQLSRLADLLCLPILIVSKHQIDSIDRQGGDLVLSIDILKQHWRQKCQGYSDYSYDHSDGLVEAIFNQKQNDIVSCFDFYRCLAEFFFVSTGDYLRLSPQINQTQANSLLYPLGLSEYEALELFHQINLRIGDEFLSSLYIATLPELSQKRILSKINVLDSAKSWLNSRLYDDVSICDCHVHLGSAFKAEKVWPEFLNDVERYFVEHRIGKLKHKFGFDIQQLFTPQHFLASVLRHLLTVFVQLGSYNIQISRTEADTIALFSQYTGDESLQSQWSVLFDLIGRVKSLALRNRLSGGCDISEQWLMTKMSSLIVNWSNLPKSYQVNAKQYISLFWLYIYLKSRFFSYFTQKPGLEGLLFFIDVYARGRSLNQSRLQVQQSASSVAAHLSPHQRVNYIEVRVAPDVDDLLPVLENVKRLNDESSKTDIKVVVHFIKWSKLRQAKPGDKYSHGQTIQMALKEMRVHASELQQLLMFCAAKRLHDEIVGLDVAGPELNRPNWMYLPLFEEFRPWWRENFGDGNGFGYTFHCGEDFLHLQSGLRRVFEVVEFFPWEIGDRLGHGLALGIEPEYWQQRKEPIFSRIDEQLFDLIIEWLLMAENRLPELLGLGHRLLLEQQIKRLGRKLLQKEAFEHIEDYVQFYRALFNSALVSHALGSPVYWHIPNRKSLFDEAGAQSREMLPALKHYFTFINGDNIESAIYPMRQTVDEIKLETKRQQLIQDWLIEQVSKKGYAVEACPSSNLTIRRLTGMAEHPMFKLNDRIPILINTDNPLVNNTDLIFEYRKVFEAEIERHGDHERAYQLISHYIHNSERYRFWRGELKGRVR